MLFFSIACLVSVVSLFVSIRILVSLLRKRVASFKVGSSNQIQDGQDSRSKLSLKRTQSMDKLEANKFSQWQHYCIALLAAFEVRLPGLEPFSAAKRVQLAQDLPMGVINTIYLVRSISECLEAASADRDNLKRVCDLKPGTQTVVLLLSCITVSFSRLWGGPAILSDGGVPSAVRMAMRLQSWAMLVMKGTQLAQLKQKWQDQRELEAEIESVVSQLEQTAGPEISLHVENMMPASAEQSKRISHTDGNEIKERLAKRQLESTAHTATADSELASISPGVSEPLPRDSSE
jgi:hypothetical protein